MVEMAHLGLEDTLNVGLSLHNEKVGGEVVGDEAHDDAHAHDGERVHERTPTGGDERGGASANEEGGARSLPE